MVYRSQKAEDSTIIELRSSIKVMKKLIISIAAGIIIVIALPLLIGFYLSPRDELKESDAVVVVSGGETEARIKEGVSLYNKGLTKKIIFSGAAREGDVSNALAMKRIAVASGVPADDILIEEKSKDTVENAKFSSLIIKEEGFKSIILTTSPYHQRRTYRNFREELTGVTILNWSATDSTWRKYGWWRTADGRRLTFSELAKILYMSTKEDY